MGRVVVLWGLFGGVDSGEVGHETETDDGSGRDDDLGCGLGVYEFLEV